MDISGFAERSRRISGQGRVAAADRRQSVRVLAEQRAGGTWGDKCGKKMGENQVKTTWNPLKCWEKPVHFVIKWLEDTWSKMDFPFFPTFSRVTGWSLDSIRSVSFRSLALFFPQAIACRCYGNEHREAAPALLSLGEDDTLCDSPLPSGYVKIAIENGHRKSEFSH